MYMLIIALVTVIEFPNEIEDHVDLIEYNHHYDNQARPAFCQYVFYEWNPELADFVVREWRMDKWPESRVTKNYRSGYYEFRFRDGAVLRHIKATSLCETWSQVDPERLNLSILPLEKRRGFYYPKPKRSPIFSNP
jgi:hypothetical protein